MGCCVSKPIELDIDKDEQTGYMAPNKFLSDRNDAIEASLQKARREDRNATKILLLGAGESGKSTVLKQMRLLHGTGFTLPERQLYTKVMFHHGVKSMKTLLKFAQMLDIQLECDNPNSPLYKYKNIMLTCEDYNLSNAEMNMEQVEFLARHAISVDRKAEEEAAALFVGAGSKKLAARHPGDVGEGHAESRGLLDDVGLDGQLHRSEGGLEDEFDFGFNHDTRHESLIGDLKPTKKEVAEAITGLWNQDPGVRQCFEQSNRFQLEVNTPHYFENIEKFVDDDYAASDQDILLGRIKTSGVHHMTFNIKGGILKMFDVGGQRAERKKWIHCFDDVQAILYVAAVSEYDEYLYEDASIRRMDETFQLFDQICNSRWFKNTPIILFLNKTDRLQKKLNKSPFTDYFPDYAGDPKSVEGVCNYFLQRFKALDKNRRRQVYRHNTCATDSKSMSFVIAAVADAVFQKNLVWSGLI